MRDRGLLFRRILSTLLFTIFVLVGRTPAPAQDSARDRAYWLRVHLAQVEGAYLESLADPSTSQEAAIKLERLRLDLRIKLEALFRRATSSEATVAIYRADAETTLDAIRAYEKVLGEGTGEETTFMNVLSDQELQGMRGILRTRLDALKLDRLKYPEHHLSTTLEFRIRELEGWVSGLDLEVARRGRIGQVQLKAIRSGILAEDARSTYPAINIADGTGREQNFQKRVALQVNVRLNTASEDASLAVLRDGILKITPPPISRPNARGPPVSINEAFNRLQLAQLDEYTAVTRRDPVAIAQARATLTTNREWLRQAYPESRAAESGFSGTSTEELINLREGWQNWYARLIVEQQPLGNALVDLEIKEAESRIRELSTVIERRLLTPPPEGGDFGVSLADAPQPPPGPETRALARTWNRQLAHNELTELAKLSNQKVSVQPIEITEAATRAFRSRITAEATSIRNAYQETIQLQRKVLVSGRGEPATELARQIRRARNLIQSSAQDLRISLADPAFAGDPEVAEVVKSLSDVPPLKASKGSDSLGRALTALENARETAEVAVQPRAVQIQNVVDSRLSADPAYRITLPTMTADDPNPLIKRPADYKALYSHPQKLSEILQDPKRAPGGVIVDAILPAGLADRINQLEVETSSGSIKVRLDGSWRTLKLRPDPLLARLAWAFVSDEQIAVIDLRPLKGTEALWLFRQYGDGRLPPSERDRAVDQLGRLTSVNVNDALRDTSLVPHLIAADQLMFDLLPQSAIAIQGGDVRYGLQLKELRLAFRADAGAELNLPNWQDVLFNKAIVAISQIGYEEGPQLILSPKLSFNLFGVPAKGSNILRMSASERWFAAHEDQLKNLDQLAPLCEFATLVALFRTIHQRQIPNNLDDLIAVTVPEFSAPRFIVRQDRIGLQWQQLRHSLSRREP